MPQLGQAAQDQSLAHQQHRQASESRSQNATRSSRSAIIPAQRQFTPSNVHQWARLPDINIRVPPVTVNPRFFGPGVQFWLDDGRQVPSQLRLAGLPTQNSPQAINQLRACYGDRATEHYIQARNHADSFAHLGGGVNMSNSWLSPRRLAKIREHLIEALKHAPKFAEAWVLLARTLSAQDKQVKIDAEWSMPADFVRAMAAAVSKPFDAPVLMQLLSALPAPETIPPFLKTPQPGQEPSLPLDKKRLALYLLRFVDPAHEAALSALAESGGRVKVGKLLPIGGADNKRYLQADDLGAIAAMRMGEVWPMMSSSQLADGRSQILAIGSGAFLTKDQFIWLIRLETEEEAPNINQPSDASDDEEMDFFRFDRNHGRAMCLNGLAHTLPNSTSWLYVPNHMLINAMQMRALARTYQGQHGAFDALRTACGDGQTTPLPVYRKTILSPNWINFYEKIMRGESDPELYRDLVRDAEHLPERSMNQDQPYVMILGQAYSKPELLLRADLFENRQKPVKYQSAVPALQLYLHCVNDTALHSNQNPVKAKNQSFVMNVGTQTAFPLVQLLDEPVLRRQSQSMENQLIQAVRDFLVQFDEDRPAPFRQLTEEQRMLDGDFNRALTIIDFYQDMSGRCEELQARYRDQLLEAQALAHQQGLTVPETHFPLLPNNWVTPDRCDACQESDVTEEDPLIAAPFDRGGHRLCLAEKMVKTGQPDIRGMLQDSPALRFLDWVNQAKTALRTLSQFISANQPRHEPDVDMEAQDADMEVDLDALEAGHGGNRVRFNLNHADSLSQMSTDQSSDSESDIDV